MSYGKEILDSIKFAIEHNDKDFFDVIVNGISEPEPQKNVSLNGYKFTGYIIKEQRLTDAEKKEKANNLCKTLMSQLQSEETYIDAIETLKTELSKDGFAKIVAHALIADGYGSDIYNKSFDDLIWNGIEPLFCIDVIETPKEKHPSAIAHCDIEIYLTHRKTDEKTLIDFGTQRQAKALYLWFLLHPRTELSRDDIKENFDDIFEIYIALSGSRLDSEKKDFDTFFKNARPKANDVVYSALCERDSATWYEINLERKYSGGVFALSLPSEYIHLHEMIKKFRNTTTLKKKDSH